MMIKYVVATGLLLAFTVPGLATSSTTTTTTGAGDDHDDRAILRGSSPLDETLHGRNLKADRRHDCCRSLFGSVTGPSKADRAP